MTNFENPTAVLVFSGSAVASSFLSWLMGFSLTEWSAVAGIIYFSTMTIAALYKLRKDIKNDKD